MKPASQRALSFIISLAFLVASVIVYGMFIVPTNESVQVLRGVVVLKNSELKQQETALNNLNELLKEFNDLADVQEKMALSLPSDPNVAQVVNTLSGLSAVNNVPIKNISVQINAAKKDPMQPSYVQNLGNLKSNFVVIGSYDNLKNFIRQIEQNVRLMDIQQIGISEEKQNNSPLSTATSSRQYSFSIDLRAYFQDPILVTKLAATSTTSNVK